MWKFTDSNNNFCIKFIKTIYLFSLTIKHWWINKEVAKNWIHLSFNWKRTSITLHLKMNMKNKYFNILIKYWSWHHKDIPFSSLKYNRLLHKIIRFLIISILFFHIPLYCEYFINVRAVIELNYVSTKWYAGILFLNKQFELDNNTISIQRYKSIRKYVKIRRNQIFLCKNKLAFFNSLGIKLFVDKKNNLLNLDKYWYNSKNNLFKIRFRFSFQFSVYNFETWTFNINELKHFK